jgi:hypothetical protein
MQLGVAMRLAIAVAGALLLAGCPIPQPLPDYPPGTITPPRILVDSIFPTQPFIRVGTDCLPGEEPSFAMSARVFDSNNLEQVAARWFVNYDEAVPGTWSPQGGTLPVPADQDSLVLQRTVPPFTFAPYGFPRPNGTPGTIDSFPFNEPGTIRVVELLVSNNFLEPPGSAVPPYRAAAANFEVQIHRWVFALVPGDENCGLHAAP